jgi:hypothetical protein
MLRLNKQKANLKSWLFSKATTGFEPVNGGFADLCLTTWLRRRKVTISKFYGKNLVSIYGFILP